MTRVGILLFDQVDLLDAGGPYEVVLTANRLAVKTGGEAPFEVVTVAPTAEPVTAYGGLRLIPDLAVDQAGSFDVVIVPGAIAIDGVIADPQIAEAVSRLLSGSSLHASVCTGAFILAAHGVLEGRAWTTHWEDVDILADRIGPEGARRGVRWVDSGPVVTAAGLSSGIAMALHLVARLAGRDLAERTARQIEYDWEPDAGS